MTFIDFYKEKENKKYNILLNEDPMTIAATVLGIGVATQLSVFGLTLIARANIFTLKKLAAFINKTWKEAKEIKQNLLGKIEDGEKKSMKPVTNNTEVKKEKSRIEKINDKYSDELKDLYEDIKNKDFESAKEEYKNLDPRTKNNPEVQRAIIIEITKIMKEPPLYVRSPGNNTYQAIKQIMNIRLAQAAAESVKKAIKEIEEN